MSGATLALRGVAGSFSACPGLLQPCLLRPPAPLQAPIGKRTASPPKCWKIKLPRSKYTLETLPRPNDPSVEIKEVGWGLVLLGFEASGLWGGLNLE